MPRLCRFAATVIVAAATVAFAPAARAQVRADESPPVVILAGRVFDGAQDRVVGPLEILVREGRIVAMDRRVERPAGALVVDLSRDVVTPGLFDLHEHPTVRNAGDASSSARELAQSSSAMKTLVAQHNLERVLLAGFTTVRIVGGNDLEWGLVDLRRAIAAGLVDGPRLFVAAHAGGAIGGHADALQSYAGNPALARLVAAPGIGSGADFFVRWVREEFRYGSNLIKIMASGGFATPNDLPDQPQMSEEEVRAVIQTAHGVGLPVTAHAYPGDVILMLVRNGIDGIEHGSLIDEPAVRAMEQAGTALVPTMSIFDPGIALDSAALAGLPPYFAAKLRQYHPQLEAARRLIVGSRIRIGYGSDCGFGFPCWEAYREFESMVHSGMTPFQALHAATSVAAGIVGRDDLGTLAVGKTADIVAWSADPTQDPRALRTCVFVMKEGRIYRRP
jgi:imidazolonepropionase-like amidohydrolase